MLVLNIPVLQGVQSLDGAFGEEQWISIFTKHSAYKSCSRPSTFTQLGGTANKVCAGWSSWAAAPSGLHVMCVRASNSPQSPPHKEWGAWWHLMQMLREAEKCYRIQTQQSTHVSHSTSVRNLSWCTWTKPLPPKQDEFWCIKAVSCRATWYTCIMLWASGWMDFIMLRSKITLWKSDCYQKSISTSSVQWAQPELGLEDPSWIWLALR